MSNNPTQWSFMKAPRCGAKTRRATTCKSPAMKNGRCRMHGGKSTGPPKGSQNALKHGFYTREAIEERKAARMLRKGLLEMLDGFEND